MECENPMDDPLVMASLEKVAKDVAKDMGIPSDLLDNMDVMVASLVAFLDDPSNMDLLLPFLEKVQDVEEDVGIAASNLLQGFGYNNSDQFLSEMREK